MKTLTVIWTRIPNLYNRPFIRARGIMADVTLFEVCTTRDELAGYLLTIPEWDYVVPVEAV